MTKTSKYRNYGLVRDLNLSDVADSTLALNSLLDNLPVTIAPKTFTSPDLSPIRGLISGNINTEILRQFVDTAPKFDTTDPITNVTTTSLIRPIPRVQDAVNEINAVVGEVPRFEGGRGLTTTFIPSNFISENTTSVSPDGNWFDKVSVKVTTNFLTNPDLVTDDDIWVTGEFNFTSKMLPSFPDDGGGMVWTGIFKPLFFDAQHDWTITATGGVQVEVEETPGNYIQYANTTARGTALDLLFDNAADTAFGEFGYVANAQFPAAIASDPDYAILRSDYRRVYGFGATIITMQMNSGAAFDVSDLALQPTQGGDIEDSPSAYFVIPGITTEILDDIYARAVAAGYTGPQNQTMESVIFVNTSYSYANERVTTITPIALPQDPEFFDGQRMRMFWYYPPDYENEWTGEVKSCSYIYNTAPNYYTNWNTERPVASSDDLNFFNMYTNSTTSWRPNIGSGSVANDGSEYQDFSSNGSVTVLWNPTFYTNWAGITRIDNNAITGDLNTRNYIIGSQQFAKGDVLIPADTSAHAAHFATSSGAGFNYYQMKIDRNLNGILAQIPITDFVSAVDGEDEIFYCLIGSAIKDVFLGDNNSGTTTFTVASDYRSTFNVAVDDRVLVQGVGLDANSYRVISVDYTNFTFTTDAAFAETGFGAGTDEYRVVIVPTSGISDYSKIDFCEDIFGYKTNATISVGSNIITLDDTTGVQIGQVCQFDGSIPAGSVVTNFTPNTDVTINNALTADIPIQAYVVFGPASTGVINKESCVLPFDVSPPFVGTQQGLTTSGKNIRSTFDPFSVKVTNSLISQGGTNVTPIVSDYAYNQTLEIGSRTDGFTYKLIAKNPTP